MAYLDHNHSHKRLAGVTGVALVHVVLALGLTAGLAINYVKEDAPPIVVATFTPAPLPTPTDTPEPTERAEDPIVLPTAPDRPVDLNDPPPLPPVPDDLPGDATTHTGGTLIELPPPTLPLQPSGPPLVAPRGPVPANGPTGWVTTNDYPRIALTREYEGTVRYQVEVGANGRVQLCQVVASSGHDLLDREACEKIERRARFRPATDRYGEQVPSTYRGSVSWQIPD